MPTNFTSRKTVRDALTALFTTYNTATPLWAEVYKHVVPIKDFAGRSPILRILPDGSEKRFNNEWTNPTEFRFEISNYVLVYRARDNWSSDDATDKIDECEEVISQIIRDNAGGIANACNQLRFAGASDVTYDMKEGTLYAIETFTVIADLFSGAI